MKFGIQMMGFIEGLFMGSVLGMLIFHYVVQRNRKVRFRKKYGAYQRRIFREMEEIKFRQMHLDEYHFLEYNLSEVLVVQPQIIIA